MAHPQLYYGFIGVTLAWQLMFVVIGLDPVRFRLGMLPAIVEKASFAFAMPILYFQDRVPAIWLAFAGMDGVLGVLFVIAFLLTRKAKM